jgi:hypothetical protein
MDVVLAADVFHVTVSPTTIAIAEGVKSFDDVALTVWSTASAGSTASPRPAAAVREKVSVA